MFFSLTHIIALPSTGFGLCRKKGKKIAHNLIETIAILLLHIFIAVRRERQTFEMSSAFFFYFSVPLKCRSKVDDNGRV